MAGSASLVMRRWPRSWRSPATPNTRRRRPEMQRELPVGNGLEAAAGTARSVESGAPVRTDTAPGRREMNVAVLKTKAEQSLAEAFSGTAARLPGGAEVRKLRSEAMRR